MSRHVRVAVRDVRNKFQSKITDVRTRVAEALSVLGPSAGEATQKIINDIGEWLVMGGAVWCCASAPNRRGLLYTCW